MININPEYVDYVIKRGDFARVETARIRVASLLGVPDEQISTLSIIQAFNKMYSEGKLTEVSPYLYRRNGIITV